MRRAILLVLLAACSKKPAKPDDKAFAAMTPLQKCDATLPRAKSCTDELMIAEIRSLGPETGELGAQLEKEIGDTPTYKDEAEAIHKQACLGSVDDGYTRGILACWDVDGCKPFADCVIKAERAIAEAKRKVPEVDGPENIDDDANADGAGSAGSGSAHPKIQLVE